MHSARCVHQPEPLYSVCSTDIDTNPSGLILLSSMLWYDDGFEVCELRYDASVGGRSMWDSIWPLHCLGCLVRTQSRPLWMS